MFQVYNSQKEISSSLQTFLQSAIPNIRKTQLNIIPPIIFGMIMAESSTTSDIAKELKDEFSLVQFDSITRRIRRLFNNKLFDPYSFYRSIIKYIISKYKKKHSDKRVHITFDHMYSHDNYTVFMITMRIGKQGIPLYFECFKGKENSEAFLDSTIMKGISEVSNLFDNSFDLIFLADRLFNSSAVLNHISSLGHTYCVRLKGNLKAFVHDKKEDHYIYKHIEDLYCYQHHSTYYSDVYLYDDKSLKTNVAIVEKKDMMNLGSSPPTLILIEPLENINIVLGPLKVYLKIKNRMVFSLNLLIILTSKHLLLCILLCVFVSFFLLF